MIDVKLVLMQFKTNMVVEKHNSFQPKPWILPTIVFAQFFCTSLWFASNAIMFDLMQHFQLDNSALSNLTSAIQFGFISGTFIFALLTITDRFSPSKVFLFSALIGSLFNFGTCLEGNSMSTLIALRFMTGFFLAGIYPVGMKIASDYYEKGLGKSLGFLVGALVLGTAFPHLLKSFGAFIQWKSVIWITSGLAITGGVLIFLLVPDGPFRKPMQQLDFSTLFTIFKNRKFKAAAFGYFGHMWELYAFWTFVPYLLFTHGLLHKDMSFSTPFYAFLIIGSGSLACIIGGYISENWGTQKTASFALFSSCLCCLLSPFFLYYANPTLFLLFLFFWGMMVVADSPLFSTLVAGNASPETKGTALTIVNSIGFAITIFSIQLLNYLIGNYPSNYLFMLLAIGPILGLSALFRNR